MNQHALIFTRNGQGRGLYTESIDLESIGDLTIRRASEVEFCNASQQWTVRLPGNDRVLFRHPSRQVCLDWERQYLEQLETLCHELPDHDHSNAIGA